MPFIDDDYVPTPIHARTIVPMPLPMPSSQIFFEPWVYGSADRVAVLQKQIKILSEPIVLPPVPTVWERLVEGDGVDGSS